MTFSGKTIAVCLSAALLLAFWARHTMRMRDAGRFDFTPNIAALNGSPYGKTLALALEGPVSTYWHAESGGEHHHEAGEECEACRHEHQAEAAKGFIERLETAKTKPNTPYGMSPAHKKYLYRQIERKLQTAYALDPGNFANFSVLYMFLSEAGLGTRTVDPQAALALAERTRAHVEREKVNPEPWLTAAAAMSGKSVQIYQSGEKKQEIRMEFEKSLKEFEFCLSRYMVLRKTAEESGRWAGFPSARKKAMDERAAGLDGIFQAQSKILRDQL